MQVHGRQRVRGLLQSAALLLLLSPLPVDAQNSIAWARQLYNQGRYDQAIVAAARVMSIPSQADVANLIVGRSHLERFRRSSDKADLVAGREALRQVKAASLQPRDQLEYVIGLGEALFLEEAFGPAGEMFESALARSLDADSRTADRVFDWWASALDRQVQEADIPTREAVYSRIVERAHAMLARHTAAGSPSYWLVVGYRALGQTVRAWDAAVAGWMRAPLTPDQGVALRGDLERMVLLALIPERARHEETGDRDRERAATALRSAWETVKRDWGPK
jgi:tetratricopeptide (TPR) repeat protein